MLSWWYYGHPIFVIFVIYWHNRYELGVLDYYAHNFRVNRCLSVWVKNRPNYDYSQSYFELLVVCGIAVDFLSHTLYNNKKIGNIIVTSRGYKKDVCTQNFLCHVTCLHVMQLFGRQKAKLRSIRLCLTWKRSFAMSIVAQSTLEVNLIFWRARTRFRCIS